MTHGLAPTARFAELLEATRATADHLETRDTYDQSDPTFQHWLRTGEVPADSDGEYWRPWLSRVREATARGVRIRRLRVVSEPVSDYIRFEHTCAAMNVSAGEDVRWLPRRRASALLLPGNDGWIFDGRIARFHLFDGDGRAVENLDCDDPVIATRAAAAFESAWTRAIPHGEYDPDRPLD